MFISPAGVLVFGKCSKYITVLDFVVTCRTLPVRGQLESFRQKQTINGRTLLTDESLDYYVNRNALAHVQFIAEYVLGHYNHDDAHLRLHHLHLRRWYHRIADRVLASRCIGQGLR